MARTVTNREHMGYNIHHIADASGVVDVTSALLPKYRDRIKRAAHKLERDLKLNRKTRQ